MPFRTLTSLVLLTGLALGCGDDDATPMDGGSATKYQKAMCAAPLLFRPALPPLPPSALPLPDRCMLAIT